MLILSRVSGRYRIAQRTILFSVLCAWASQVFGCICGMAVKEYVVTGSILDSDSMQGLSDAFIGGRILTEGVETVFVPAVFGHGEPSLPAPSPEGTFRVPFGKYEGFSFPGPLPEIDLPAPDQVEVIAVRGDCEQSFLIDLNEDTVVDLTFPENGIELREPILVPPCEE